MPATANTVTVNFSLDRTLYNKYKHIVTSHNENVKGNLIKYMQTVIQYGTPNADTLAAIKEVEELKKSHKKKTYDSFDAILAELDDEI